MAGSVLVRAGARIHWVGPVGGPTRSVAISENLGEAARALQRQFSDGLPVALRRAVASDPPSACLDPDLAAALRRIGVGLAELPLARARALREAIPPPAPAEERELALALAHAALEEALRSPEETLISLAREEERVERALRREGGAAEQFLTAPGSSLEAYVAEWGKFRERFEEHHARLLARLERAAEEVVPNLSAVVGPRVAARLVAQAPGLSALARMSAARLQLLGARRRPSTSRGPRFGLLFRAERMTDVPADRAGALARSVAALAVIAARADATTHAALGPLLVGRRDRRIERLRRRPSP